VACVLVRQLRVRQGVAVRRSGARLSDADGRGVVSGRRAADGTGHDRRIPGSLVRGSQAAAAVSDRRASRSRFALSLLVSPGDEYGYSPGPLAQGGDDPAAGAE